MAVQSIAAHLWIGLLLGIEQLTLFTHPHLRLVQIFHKRKDFTYLIMTQIHEDYDQGMKYTATLGRL